MEKWFPVRQKQHHKVAQQISISGSYHSHHVVIVVTWTEQNFFSLIISHYQLVSSARSPLLIPHQQALTFG